MLELSYECHIPVKDEIYLISLDLADLTGVRTPFIGPPLVRVALRFLPAT